VAKACDDGVDCTDDGCLEGECSHIADDQNCKDGNGCTSSTCDTDQGGCVYTELPEKNGGPCDDGNDDTTGDFCLTGHCAGMKITDVNVQGVSKSTALDHVTWSNGTFYIAGVEHVGGKDDSFLAVVTGTTASAIKKSIIEEEEYVAVHDRIALTEDADVLFNDNGTWDWNSKLDNSLGKTKVSNATAGWGFVSQNSGTFFFAGRSSQFKGGAWTVRCLGKNFTCAKVPVDMEQYSFAKSEHPRAIGGWHDGNKYGPILLADGKTSSGKNYNDAFTINAGAKSWATNYLDNSSSSSESTDVAGIDGSNLWWVGTNGLIRTGLTSGSPAWNSVNALSKQSELSFYGVAVDEHIVIMAGIRKSGNKVHLVLVTHNTLAGLSSEDAWYEYTLDSYEGSINDFVPTMRLTDIAMYKGNLVATGFRMEGIINSFQSLLVTRSAPYKK